ncbi:hypothetical protein SAMN05444487_10354 [Marininema mesophilum]|uniref:Uncharacterized protein n=1 Tax=Marininema mesophilum TaxID=1048340 RepID=A0A1H2T7T2_9BACL|nr:hypothetical protein [Marininema mesophilum]SDW40016.1 hypothetical protein SAMN05444487_10354 [Marininema mesophilum]
MNQRLLSFLVEIRPDNIDVDVVWSYMIMFVQDENLTIQQLIYEYDRYIAGKMCGSQGIAFISKWDGTMRAGVGMNKETCDETLFLDHWKRVIDEYAKNYVDD